MVFETNEFLLSEELAYIMQKAAYITAVCKDREINTTYVTLAILDSYNQVSDTLTELLGINYRLSDFEASIKTKPDFLKKIFDEEMAEHLSSAFINSFSVDAIRKLLLKADENSEITAFNFLSSTFSNIQEDDIEYSDNLYSCLLDAQIRAGNGTENVIDLPNFAYCMFSKKDTSARKLLKYIKVSVDDILTILESEFTINSDEIIKTDEFKIPYSISSFCEVLNDNYEEGCVCDILGRDKEIKKFWIIAQRKFKRNAILIGKPGCGKTAIAEAITMQIVNKKCPRQFYGYKVISMDVTSLTAGTEYRGSFEGKVSSLISFLKETPKIILFVDEIHHMLGAGRCEGATSDLAGMLKPILARDDAILIGGTTKDEYQTYFPTDGAFARRFDTIYVKEPKIKELKEMISARVKNLSSYHKVEVPDDVLDYIIVQAHAFYPQVANPDKTLTLCDSSMAVAKGKKKHVLTKKDVDDVNIEHIKRFKSYSKFERTRIAYHEAGHYVASRVLKSLRDEEAISLSIIATDFYLGAYSFEIDENISINGDKKYYIEKMIGLMAGRASEKFFFNNINNGARSDLQEIMKLARHMIINSGMDIDSDYFNLALLGEDEDDIFMLTDKQKNDIASKIKELVDDVYKESLALVNSNKESIKLIGNALAKNGILTKDELDEYFKSGQSLKKKASSK